MLKAFAFLFFGIISLFVSYLLIFCLTSSPESLQTMTGTQIQQLIQQTLDDSINIGLRIGIILTTINFAINGFTNKNAKPATQMAGAGFATGNTQQSSETTTQDFVEEVVNTYNYATEQQKSAALDACLQLSSGGNVHISQLHRCAQSYSEQE